LSELILRVFGVAGVDDAAAFARWQLCVSSAAVDVDPLGARAALDVATPVVLAVAPMSHLYRFDRVTSTTAHRPAASGPRVILLTLPATGVSRHMQH